MTLLKTAQPRSRNPFTVLVTGVGAIIGYGIIRSLRLSRAVPRIIGMDIYADAVGRRWCDHFEPAPLASAPNYVQFMTDLSKRQGIDLVIPGIEQDMRRMRREYSLLENGNVRLAINSPRLIDLAEDKWLFHTHLIGLGFSQIKSRIDGTFDMAAAELGLPMLMKPRRSYASKGIQLIHNEVDFVYWQNKLGDNFMVQEIVGNDSEEYTVGAFGYGDGTTSRCIILRRTLSGEGATAKAEVVDHPIIEAHIRHYAKALYPIGPTNFQYRMHRGTPILLEINPRISSSTSLRTAFGFNESEMCVDYFLNNIRPDVDHIRKGKATRFIEDWVQHDSTDS